MNAIGVVGLILNLCVYNFVSQEIRAEKYQKFEIFYINNILLNEGIRTWMAAQNQPRENFILLKMFYHMKTLFSWSWLRNHRFRLVGQKCPTYQVFQSLTQPIIEFYSTKYEYSKQIVKFEFESKFRVLIFPIWIFLFFLIPIMSWISMTCQAGDYYKFKRECEICGQIPTEMQNLRSPSPHHLSNFSPFFPHRKWTSLKWNLLFRPPTFAYLWYNPPDFFYYVSNPNYKNYLKNNNNNNKVKFLDFFLLYITYLLIIHQIKLFYMLLFFSSIKLTKITSYKDLFHLVFKVLYYI